MDHKVGKGINVGQMNARENILGNASERYGAERLISADDSPLGRSLLVGHFQGILNLVCRFNHASIHGLKHASNSKGCLSYAYLKQMSSQRWKFRVFRIDRFDSLQVMMRLL